ncbi:MAG: hypothetical protein WBX02_17205, partial [Terriglobales bacterium]
MDERDRRRKDSDSPTMPGTRLPGSEDAIGAAALTPPPLSNPPISDAQTLAHGSGLPGLTQALPYVRGAHPSPPSTPSVPGISAFLSLQPGVVFGG